MSDRPIAERLLGPDGPELGCDECFEFLDRYVEAEVAGEPALHGCPRCVSPEACEQAGACLGMRAHLEGCPACAEEHASLTALLAGS
ncbi:MAG TPA: hypothetical protein VHI30_08520 [Gaiellales bacterium]|jgi:hypothetical protein|nr:hypothetical protein [Gaiellales bacterium]